MAEDGFAHHVRACNNIRLPADRTPLWIGSQPVGWLAPAIAAALRDHPKFRSGPTGLLLTDPAALPEIARALAQQGLFRWRDEAFDVHQAIGGPALARIDRGALPAFGIQAQGVHVNGLVTRPDGLHIWVARRAADKALDPGKLDHIVAGGVPSGLDPMQTLIKEAGEEASISADLACRAVPVGRIGYTMLRAEGLRRDVLACYDLELPDDFEPVAADGEVEAFELWPIARVAETVRDTDKFKFNVNLVLIDLFIRRGLIADGQAKALAAALAGPLTQAGEPG